MEHSIATYFLLFMIFACSGWIMEVTLGLIQKHKFTNRGFLIGPYCPIYGCGGILITLTLTQLKEHPVVLFTMALVVCGLLEYITSYVMEKIFHARWWDYSKNKFNINGRICLETIIPFGILGLIIIYIVNPFILGLLGKVPENVLNVIAIIIAVLFLADNIVSFKVISNVRATTKKYDKESTKDNTEEISAKVREVLRNKSFLNRRLIDAFPNFTAILKQQSEKIKKKTAEVREDVVNKANEAKEDLTNKVVELKEDFTNRTVKMKDGIVSKATGMKKNISNKAENVKKKSKKVKKA